MNATSRLQPAVQPALQLIQRDDCPLCDQALAVLAAARATELESVWIEDVDELAAAYGLRVPVLRDTVTGDELDWPFDAGGGLTWLAGAQSRWDPGTRGDEWGEGGW